MISRILLYLLGVFLSSFGLSIIIIYLSYINTGYNILEILQLIIKNKATILFILGTYLSFKALSTNKSKKTY